MKFDDELGRRARRFMKALAMAAAAWPGAMEVIMKDDSGEVYVNYNYRNKEEWKDEE